MNTINLPADHNERVERMRLSLDGLGLGDALGEMLSYGALNAPKLLAANDLPPAPWRHTDDTEMALSIVDVLELRGELDQDELARRFAERYRRDPDRGYGKMTRIQLQQMISGGEWRGLAMSVFGGKGSMGNGGAMRVAPLGAYFADNLGACAAAACASAFVTHAHPEGVAGTIAVAVAAAMAWQLRNEPEWSFAKKLFAEVLRFTPKGDVFNGILRAGQTSVRTSLADVAKSLGNGSLVTAADTVPFCLWIAANNSHDFTGAIGKTISADGDCDTNAAIVGGIVALSAGRNAIPSKWLEAREANEG